MRTNTQRMGGCPEVKSGGTTVAGVIPKQNLKRVGRMTSDAPVRVMLVDGHQVMRDLLRDALETTGEFRVVAQAADGEEALRMLEEAAPGVIVMDLITPGMEGVEACREITDRLPGARVLMLTATDEQEAVVRSIAAGATGYLQKNSGKEQLLATLREVARGSSESLESAVQRLSRAVRDGPEDGASEPLRGLMELDREVLRLFAGGLSYREIGEIRNTSAQAARNVLSRIERKLGFRNRRQLLVLTGLIGPSESVPGPLDALTKREREILELFSQGLSPQEIGERCNIGAPTVRSAISKIQGKLGFGNRRQLLAWAGLTGPSESVPEPLNALTEREREFLELFAQGLSHQEIGELCNIGAQTVGNAVSRMQRKLGFGTRQQLLVWAVRTGSSESAPGPPDALAYREREILKLFAQGLSYQEIGEMRNISAKTARNAVSGIQKKLGFGNRRQLVAWAVRSGLVDGGQPLPAPSAPWVGDSTKPSSGELGPCQLRSGQGTNASGDRRFNLHAPAGVEMEWMLGAGLPEPGAGRSGQEGQG